MTARKPRAPRSAIAKLPAEQRRQIEAWMRETLTYAEIGRRTLARFGVKISGAALGGYYKKLSRGELHAHGERAHRAENNVGVQITVRQIGPCEIRIEVRPLPLKRRGRPRNIAPEPRST